MAEQTEDPLAETGQAIGGALRTGAVAAGELVRMRLMHQTNRDRQAAAADQAAARDLTGRLRTERTERSTAAALYRPTHSRSWWQHASADDVARAWDAAAACADVDPNAGLALADLEQGLQERAELKATLIQDHPGSLAAQSLAPAAAEAGETAGVALAVAADLEADLNPHDQPEPAPSAEEEAWYASQRQQEDELAERGTGVSPELAGAAADAQDTDAWRRSEAERVNGARSLGEGDASTGYTEAAGVGQLVGADFPPAGLAAQTLALPTAEASTAGADTPGIARLGSGAGSPEHHQAAAIGQLVGADFPGGVDSGLPRKGRAPTMGSPPWQAQAGLARGLHATVPGASVGVEL